MTPDQKRSKEISSEEIEVVSSNEENPRRETEVDADEEREKLFTPEANEDIGLDQEQPLHRPIPTDRPLDISPRSESDGEGLGMVDEPDSATIEGYYRAERDKRESA